MSLTVDFGNCAWEKIEVFVEKERHAKAKFSGVLHERRVTSPSFVGSDAALLVAITAAQLWMKYFRAAGLLYRKPPERFRGGTVNAKLKGSHSLLHALRYQEYQEKSTAGRQVLYPAFVNHS
ncbi:uncharacterized protein EAE97_003253 [Botrytis byssoidea]|uniref:Uncharacterized protein n=1 Tax=Botrytis byssoidea TaxID=139641 RepID=A0A9P5M1Y2_9HELO|nr:uncharacterized protein EAE97_003253 [Botrytis byssoidea]KAF7949744.1 hypothetical protein EAE97_003253 [Botrytis byssoidea]